MKKKGTKKKSLRWNIWIGYCNTNNLVATIVCWTFSLSIILSILYDYLFFFFLFYFSSTSPHHHLVRSMVFFPFVPLMHARIFLFLPFVCWRKTNGQWAPLPMASVLVLLLLLLPIFFFGRYTHSTEKCLMKKIRTTITVTITRLARGNKIKAHFDDWADDRCRRRRQPFRFCEMAISHEVNIFRAH